MQFQDGILVYEGLQRISKEDEEIDVVPYNDGLRKFTFLITHSRIWVRLKGRKAVRLLLS